MWEPQSQTSLVNSEGALVGLPKAGRGSLVYGFYFLSCKDAMEWEHSSNSGVRKVSCLYCGYTKKTENRTSQKIILFENVGAKWFYIFTIYNSK